MDARACTALLARTHAHTHARTHAHPRTKQARLETMLVLCSGMSEHRRAVGQRTCIRRQGTADSNPMFTTTAFVSGSVSFFSTAITALVLTRTARSRFPIPVGELTRGLFSSLGIQARGCGSVPLVPADRGRRRGPVPDFSKAPTRTPPPESESESTGTGPGVCPHPGRRRGA
jgi:hypothetical protein